MAKKDELARLALAEAISLAHRVQATGSVYLLRILNIPRQGSHGISYL
jgi:hypothetical protein